MWVLPETLVKEAVQEVRKIAMINLTLKLYAVTLIHLISETHITTMLQMFGQPPQLKKLAIITSVTTTLGLLKAVRNTILKSKKYLMLMLAMVIAIINLTTTLNMLLAVWNTILKSKMYPTLMLEMAIAIISLTITSSMHMAKWSITLKCKNCPTPMLEMAIVIINLTPTSSTHSAELRTILKSKMCPTLMPAMVITMNSPMTITNIHLAEWKTTLISRMYPTPMPVMVITMNSPMTTLSTHSVDLVAQKSEFQAPLAMDSTFNNLIPTLVAQSAAHLEGKDPLMNLAATLLEEPLAAVIMMCSTKVEQAEASSQATTLISASEVDRSSTPLKLTVQ